MVFGFHLHLPVSQVLLSGECENAVRSDDGPTSPFDLEVSRENARDARWVEPRLVGEAELRQWTFDGRLRHPAWRGMRPDLDPLSVVLPEGLRGTRALPSRAYAACGMARADRLSTTFRGGRRHSRSRS
ncbi:hypothetical protein [Lentzea flaviverrucosa]